MFDLQLFPFYRIKGQEWPQLPGLLALTPPRKTGRGRDDDRLVIYLTFSGNVPLSSGEYNQMTTRMAQQFYQTAGSLTSAIRAAAVTVNQMLVERNLRTTGNGQYTVGRLVMGVLRGDQFVFAQCGPTHVFHLTKSDTHHVHDAQISGRGLGIGQTTPLYFSQLELAAGEQLLLCADLPDGWEAALLAESPGSVDALRRDLFTITGDDLNAVLVQAMPGKGILNIIKTLPTPGVTTSDGTKEPVVEEEGSPVSVPTTQPAPTPPAAQILPTSHVESGRPASRFARLVAGVEATPSEKSPEQVTQTNDLETPIPADRPRPQGSALAPVRRSMQASSPSSMTKVARAGRFGGARAAGDLPEIKRPPASHKGVYRGLAKFLHGFRERTQRLSDGIKKFLPKLLPNQGEGEAEVGGSSLAFFAVAIPLIIVTIAGLVYTRYGRVTQYQENYNMALGMAAQAHGQTDPTEVRRAWDSALYYLDLADNYQVTQDSRNLRQEAQTALDNLDSIVRLNFQPAINGGLDRSIQIKRLAATNTDLYLLDGALGTVSRFEWSGSGYTRDNEFTCGPGQWGGTTVGALIDIEALQMSNDYNARLMAMDANGSLLYCGLNMKPAAVTLIPPPLGWKGITAFSLDTDGKNLYVLDPAGNTVWFYTGSFGKFPNSPTIFFGQQVPQNMGASIDLAANNSDLYILFGDGHVTACPTSQYQGVPLRCTDPATFVDNRPERQPGPKITDAIFNQVSFATAPEDPLLYLLEPLTRAVYFFSPRSDSLELRGQFRTLVGQSDTLFSGSATAMTISPNKYLFIATGYQVFFATNMP